MDLVSENSFEYTLLDAKTRTMVRQCTSEIKDLMRLTAENMISIGQKLTEVKEQLGHGSFQNWLRTEFEWSEQTARQFMQVYRWSQTLKNKNFVFSQLTTSALYLLAAPSTPPEARKQVLSLVEAGEKVTYSCTKSIVERYKKIALPTAQLQSNSTGEQLFRLETTQLGRIVRLYHAAELEAITDLNIGATVKIVVGRWQGQIATIAEILTEEQLSENKSNQITQTPSFSLASNIYVHILDRTDFSNSEKLREMGQYLIINYGNVCLAIEGNSEKLTAFTAQIENNLAFVQEIFDQAWNKQKLEI